MITNSFFFSRMSQLRARLNFIACQFTLIGCQVNNTYPFITLHAHNNIYSFNLTGYDGSR